jgi:hypothetical protein
MYQEEGRTLPPHLLLDATSASISTEQFIELVS